MSTMPGASVRPRASTRCRAAPRSRPTATMRPSATATPPARAGPPRPSITEALSITRSCTRAPSAAIVRVRALHLEDVVYVRVEIAGQTAHRPQAVHVDPARGRVVEPVPHVEVDDLPQHEVGAADGHDAVEAALHGDRRVGHARRRDARGRGHREPGHLELVHLRRGTAPGPVLIPG